MTDTIDSVKEILSRTRAEVGKIIIGQPDVVDACLIAIFTGNHLLIEGVPGVGKTLLVRTLAQVLGCDFGRIQFTPDLMPADITGTSVYNVREGTFSLMRGPVFTTFLLADEINRAPAKTQSALLQAMQERTVTIDRETHTLSPQFTVFATQNPVEYEGTYPLPEAQRDRFLLQVSMDYPQRDEELQLAQSMLGQDTPEALLARQVMQPVLTPESLLQVRAELRQILIKEELVAYIVDLVRQTRRSEHLRLGAGPRATQALLVASRAMAALQGRDFVTPDDIRQMLPAVLRHRVILQPEFEIDGLTVKEALDRLIENVAVPK
jgi:MoxR-like ATPase